MLVQSSTPAWTANEPPIINAAQNLATGRWTIIVMPKKSLSPSKKKRKGTVATFCQLPWVDPHQLPPIQDWQCLTSPASTQYIPSKVHVCKVLLGQRNFLGHGQSLLYCPARVHGKEAMIHKERNPTVITRLMKANYCPGCLGFGWESGTQNWAENHFGATASDAHH